MSIGAAGAPPAPPPPGLALIAAGPCAGTRGWEREWNWGWEWEGTQPQDPGMAGFGRIIHSTLSQAPGAGGEGGFGMAPGDSREWARPWEPPEGLGLLRVCAGLDGPRGSQNIPAVPPPWREALAHAEWNFLFEFVAVAPRPHGWKEPP